MKVEEKAKGLSGLLEKAINGCGIRTMSYHDFLTDSLNPTKTAIEKAKFDLNKWLTKEWVSVDDLKQWLPRLFKDFPMPSNEKYYEQAYTGTPVFMSGAWELDFDKWKKEVGLVEEAKEKRE